MKLYDVYILHVKRLNEKKQAKEVKQSNEKKVNKSKKKSGIKKKLQWSPLRYMIKPFNFILLILFIVQCDDNFENEVPS